IYVGEALAWGQPWPLVTLLAVLAYMNGVVIPYEESRLRAAFGAAYEEYCERVARWIGRRGGFRTPGRVRRGPGVVHAGRGGCSCSEDYGGCVAPRARFGRRKVIATPISVRAAPP